MRDTVIRRISLGNLVPAIVLFLLALGPYSVSAALLFSEDFQGHANGSTVQSANGWVGDTVNVNDSANFAGSRVLDGRDLAGTPDDFAIIERGLGGNLQGNAVHRMSMDVYAQTSGLPSHNNGMGIGTTGGPSAFTGGAHWTVLYDEGGPGGTGYFFDARGITGNGSDFFRFNGPFDSVQTLEIVLDGLAGEIYGVYDFGGGAMETAHYSVNTAQIAALDKVYAFFDYRSAHPGGKFASTHLGTQFGAAQWDNIALNGSFEAVPEPATAALFGLCALGLGIARRRR